MVINKSTFLVLILVSFGFLCSGAFAYGRDTEHDPRQQYEKDENNHHLKEREGEDNNPYYFPHRRSFQALVKEEEGEFSILQKFAEKSHLHKGIDNFRIVMLKVKPNSMIIPHHNNLERIYFITNGKGTITIVTHENKETYNMKGGQIVRVPAGSTLYIVNLDSKETLTIAGLTYPVTPADSSMIFFPAGNGNPKSYYQVFRNEILESVLNTTRDRLEELFDRQRWQQTQQEQRQQGFFQRLNPEKIRAMSREKAATSPRQKGERLVVIDLLSQSPVFSNQHGRTFEACPEEFHQLQNLNVAVSVTEINQGAILVPHYNSEATVAVLVKEGNGYVEMVCPDIPSSRQSHRLSTGDVFVVPAEHPVTFVASENKKLKLIGFAINARNNQRIFLAGQKNLVTQMDSAVKEVSFGAPPEHVDEVFNNPEESFFMSFSKPRQGTGSEEKGGDLLASFVDSIF